MTAKKIAIGSDHAGFGLKEALRKHLEGKGLEVMDLGPHDRSPRDYPESAAAVGRAVVAGDAQLGVLICGSGIGISIAANKVKGVRAALVHSEYEAHMARLHNDANIVCFGERVIGVGQALGALDAFLAGGHDPGDDGRHARRVAKIHAIEEC